MEIRLATFNLENLGIREGEDSPDARQRLPLHRKALRSVIQRLDADAVAFQELVEPEQIETLIEGFDYPHVVLGERGSSPLRIGAFSRHPLKAPRSVAAGVDLSLIDRKSGLEILARGAFSRPALQVTWDVPGCPITLIVLHWKSKIPSFTSARAPDPDQAWSSLGDAGEGRVVTEVKRLAQAVQVRKAVDRILREDSEARVAVLGDFNDTLDSEVLRIVRGDARACESPSLLDAELVACELAIPRDLRFTHIYRGHREMIDHILISQSLLPHLKDVRVLNEGLRESTDGRDVDPYSDGSDHAPVIATFRV